MLILDLRLRMLVCDVSVQSLVVIGCYMGGGGYRGMSVEKRQVMINAGRRGTGGEGVGAELPCGSDESVLFRRRHLSG